MGGRTRSALLALASVLATALAVELALRLATPPSLGQQAFPNVEWLRFDPVGGWRNAPGFRTDTVTVAEISYRASLSINRLGFRGPEIATAKAPGSLRIACQGDSGTFGFWRAHSMDAPAPDSLGVDSYPFQLARLLAREGRDDVEVVNAGVLGYTTSHGLRQLVLEVLRLDPDVVTVRFGYNDHTRAWKPALRAREPATGPLRALLYAVSGWRLARVALGAHQGVGALHPAPNSVPWVSLPELERNLRRYAELSREHGFRLLFLDYPLAPPGPLPEVDRNMLVMLSGAPDVESLYRDHARYQAALRAVAADEDVPLLESAPLFRRSASTLYSPYDVVHPNGAGARALARLLLDELTALGWLDR